MNHVRCYCVLASIIFAGIATGGCVSSSLNETLQPEVAASEETKEPTFDPAAREQAVAQMRAKAENKSDEKTNAFRNQDGPLRPLTNSEANAKISALNASSKARNDQLSGGEQDANQASIDELKRKAKSHYADAVRNIEN